jgi:effector-binding domain-containing protein
MAVRDLQKKANEILQRLKTFLEDGKNAYGYKIYIAKIKTPILLASTKTSVNYPEMQTVYSTIEELKRQADANHVKITDHSMLNVTKIDNGAYQVSVAIPIEKVIPPNQNSSINRMVAGGNLLVADVNGGPNTIINAFTQVKAFMKDHNLISPAMSYESLITNRIIEKDTAKWVTKIYYPIF